MSLTALDLFAGTGWGVACAALGIDEVGVEIMPEAVATREANGMHTAFRDVWHGLDGTEVVPPHAMLIASPPCQTFSMAGKGAGRAALDEVLGLIDDRAYLDVEALRAFGEKHDPRTALVLTPLSYVARYAPLYVVLEQVPTVKPVWERIAVELRKWGYSVATDVLNAEQYGVPQTRKRAILVARADGVEARMPTPTHSRYYQASPDRLDPDVEPWVSMAEALGWGMTERPYMSIASGTDAGGGTDPATLGGSGARRAIERERDAGRWVVSTGVNSATVGPGPVRDAAMAAGDWRSIHKPQERSIDAPAPTLDGKVGGAWRIHPPGERWEYRMPARTLTANGLIPAPGVSQHDAERSVPRSSRRVNDQTGTAFDPDWPEQRPALTVAGRGLVPHPGATANATNGSTKSRNDGIRVTAEEAAALQSYPLGFTWVGSKTATFRQIGNAVPPLLARAVLEATIEGAP